MNNPMQIIQKIETILVTEKDPVKRYYYKRVLKDTIKKLENINV
jgi:ABC-type Zn uptake system ZnuABC Zn-binding protein ZnuA